MLLVWVPGEDLERAGTSIPRRTVFQGPEGLQIKNGVGQRGRLEERPMSERREEQVERLAQGPERLPHFNRASRTGNGERR